MNKILENIFENDLEFMVRNVISFDDFVSKIDDNTLVIAFYVKNEDAAEDLAVFLERSRFEWILDTEVSSTSNKDGDFLTFIEIDTKDTVPLEEKIDNLIRLVTILTNRKEWRIKNNRVLHSKTVPYSKNNINILMQKIKAHDVQQVEQPE